MRYGNKLTRYIYYNSPPRLRNLYAAIYDSRKSKIRFGSHFREYLAYLVESQFWGSERLKALEWEKTKSLLNAASDSSPYYKSLFQSVQLDVKSVDNPQFMTQIPFLTKDIVREKSSDIMMRVEGNPRYIWEHTSGTTGTALRFPSSPEVVQEYYAVRELQFMWAGITDSRKVKLAHFAGHPVVDITSTKPPFWVYNSFTKDLYFSSYHISDKTIGSYVQQLLRYRPVAVTGYPSSIYLIAEAILRNGVKTKTDAVITSSETLLDFQKAKIEEAFGCKIYDFYGNTENCGKILTCQFGKRHLLLHGGLAEVEDGELVFTNTSNFVFPFIRYKLGDRIVLSRDQGCQCGRNGLIVDSIEGRIEDYIVTRDGRKVGRLDHIFKDILNVKEAQIYQGTPGEITIRVVRETGYTARDEREIEKEAVNRLGRDTAISFEYVDRIQRSKNGKFKFIVTGHQS